MLSENYTEIRAGDIWPHPGTQGTLSDRQFPFLNCSRSAEGRSFFHSTSKTSRCHCRGEKRDLSGTSPVWCQHRSLQRGYLKTQAARSTSPPARCETTWLPECSVAFLDAPPPLTPLSHLLSSSWSQQSLNARLSPRHCGAWVQPKTVQQYSIPCSHSRNRYFMCTYCLQTTRREKQTDNSLCSV